MSYVFRRHRRVELDYVARILTVGAELICDCAVLDVSQGGARIAVLPELVSTGYVFEERAVSAPIEEVIGQNKDSLIASLQIAFAKHDQPIRVAVCGRKNAPPLFETLGQ